MTMLRSREIVSALNSKGSILENLENGVSEPVTPAKTLECWNKSFINLTPSSTSSDANPGRPSVESRSAHVRRSARLAAKLGMGDDLETIEISNRKRKNVKSKGESNSRNDECDMGNSELGVSESGLQVKKKSRLSEFRTANNGKGKNGTELGLCDLMSAKRDGEETGFLNLRSGKKVMKRTSQVNSEGPSVEGVERYGPDVKFGFEESEILLNGDYVNTDNADTDCERKMEEFVNRSSKKRLNRGEKGKGKVVDEAMLRSAVVSMRSGCEESHIWLNGDHVNTDKGMSDSQRSIEKFINSSSKKRHSREEKGKWKMVEGELSDSSLPKSSVGKVEVSDQCVIGIEIGVTTRRLQREEKEKGKLVDEDSSSSDMDALDEVENRNENASTAAIELPENAAFIDGNIVRETDARSYKKRFRDIARKNARRFAHFSAQEESGSHAAAEVAATQIPSSVAASETEDWPGPFSTAMKIIKDREMNVNGLPSYSVEKTKTVKLTWAPRNNVQCNRQKKFPSLQQLCLSVLAKHADAISSLDCVPDMLRHKLCQLLCDSRKMNYHFLKLLVSGCPTEIRLRDCSWLSEEQFTRTFESVNTSHLTVLQLDHSGCCVPDYALSAALARSVNILPALTKVSLKGAYRLSDAGIRALVSSAPSITSINLAQCSLLTSDGICSLAKSLKSVLRELYIDDCLEIDVMLILPALQKLEHLEVLSLCGIQSVCDEFIRKIVSAHGCRMKELGLADCMELSDLSLKVIAETCSELQVIDLKNLCKLSDIAIAHLANGCRATRTLKLCRNAFSDEAIATYLEMSGSSLTELSLNNVNEVSDNTAMSLAKHSRKLVSLDLSWCRNLTNEALGLIVDSCSSLEVLKLFGCYQI